MRFAGPTSASPETGQPTSAPSSTSSTDANPARHAKRRPATLRNDRAQPLGPLPDLGHVNGANDTDTFAIAPQPTRGFAQSGFNEVRSLPGQTLAPRTSQKPLDSRIGLVVIQPAGWEGGQHEWRSPIRLIFVSVRLRRYLGAGRPPPLHPTSTRLR